MPRDRWSSGARRLTTRRVSRRQLRVEELPGGRLRVTNLGRTVAPPDGSALEEDRSRELSLPSRLAIGHG